MDLRDDDLSRGRVFFISLMFCLAYIKLSYYKIVINRFVFIVKAHIRFRRFLHVLQLLFLPFLFNVIMAIYKGVEKHVHYEYRGPSHRWRLWAMETCHDSGRW